MNKYFIIAAIIFMCAVSFFSERFGEDRVTVQCDKHDAVEAQNTISAESHVIGEVKTQGQITQEETNAYDSTISAIAGLYSTGVHSTPTGTSTGVRSLPSTPIPTEASKKYGLTPEQCDTEESKCTALWTWAKRQAAVK